MRGESRPRGPPVTPRQSRASSAPAGSRGRSDAGGAPWQRHPSSRGDTNRGTGRRVPQEPSTPTSPFRVHLGRAPPSPKALSPSARRPLRFAVPGRAGHERGRGGSAGAAPCPAAAARGAAVPPAGQRRALRAPPAPARAGPAAGVPADPALWDGDPGGPKAGLSPHRPGDGGRGTPRSAEAAPLSAGVRALTSHLLLPSARPLGADIAAVISASFHSLFPHFPKKIHPERWIPSRAEGDRQCLLLLRGKD